ncbi:MAG: FGGY family carbohydrate kinase [Ruminococcus callidus]
MAYVIGVDCGTSGTKTVLFREDGTVMASATVEYPMYQPKNGYAEQDPATESCNDPNHSDRCHQKRCGKGDRALAFPLDAWSAGHAGQGKSGSGSRSSGAASVPPQGSRK